MRKIFLLVCLFASTGLFGQAGKLDSTFGANGITHFHSQSGIDGFYDMNFQSSGKIIAVGFAGKQNSLRDIAAIARFNNDGLLDKSFGVNGFADTKTMLQDYKDYEALVVCIQPDDKIVITIQDKFQHDFLLIRLTRDGEPDSSFGTNGIYSIELSDPFDPAMILQPDGKIILSINTLEGSSLFRYNNSGSLDSSFGNNGRVLIPEKRYTFPSVQSLGLTSSGKILASGYTLSSPSKSFLISFNQDGSIDSTFGNNGAVIWGTFLYSQQASEMSVLSNQKILIANENYYGETLLLRYNGDGTLDNSFGNNGSIKFQMGKGSYLTSISVQQDQKIELGWRIYITDTSKNNRSFLIRLHATGEKDNSFGTNGISQSIRKGFALAVRIGPDGKIVLCGEIDSDDYFLDFLLARYLSEDDNQIANTSKQKPVIFPNPVKSQLHISGLSGTKNTILSISDFYGNIRASVTVKQKEYIWNLSSLKRGNYILNISEEGSPPISMKFLKEN